MLNFRKLKKDFSPNVLREGQEIYDGGLVQSAKIVQLNGENVKLSCRVQGKFDNTYECEIEIDRHESMMIASDCNCTYQYDCQHLAAVLFYLQDNLDKLIVAFSNEADLDSHINDEAEKADLRKTIAKAKTKEIVREEEFLKKELLEEYVASAKVLGQSPFFLPEEKISQDKAELAIIFHDLDPCNGKTQGADLQLALRLPYRSKPLSVPDLKAFLDAIRYDETLYMGSKRYYFTMSSFDLESAQLLKLLLDMTRFNQAENQNLRLGWLDCEALGTLFAKAYDMVIARTGGNLSQLEGELDHLPYLFCGNLEDPLRFSRNFCKLLFEIDRLESPSSKILLNPKIVLPNREVKAINEILLLECARPGILFEKIYSRFPLNISRKHLRHLSGIRDIAIPEPLFGTFVENSLPELMRFAELSNQAAIEQFVTLPFTGQLRGECQITYLEGELDAELFFLYEDIKVPAASAKLSIDEIGAFITPQGILARNLTEEQQIIEDLFQDFIFDSQSGQFKAKNDKKIVEFMTEMIPRHQDSVIFHCPENLLDRFIYDDTHFTLKLQETDHIGSYLVDLKVNGHLNGVSIDLLWECLTSKRCFIELNSSRGKTDLKKGKGKNKQDTNNKILVLDLDKLAPVLQVFDEIGLTRLDSHQEERPLWSLTSIGPETFNDLPIKFSMSKRLQQIQQQMLGHVSIDPSDVPDVIQASPRVYQIEGIHWLERLRSMHLNGILADDMGLGKTLQSIVAIAQHQKNHPRDLSIVICPTSLIYNWKEEFAKFYPGIKVLPVDGTPAQRQQLIEQADHYQVLITSYTLLQKDIENYKKISFAYVILDEAQNIKNRGTRNAKSVKQLKSAHKLILTGTPIENSLEDLWSLFDFLMPGLLSNYDRFVDKYIRSPTPGEKVDLELLRQKLSPFILRRMKKDVLKELPPVTEIVYHCHLSDTQRELYRSYAESARKELSDMVKREGFDKIQIHVLATLTRLKQICCHPAIFAKDHAEEGDSSKYEMLKDLLQSLIEGNHKTVIFSQYTRMLQIIRQDLEKQGIDFAYLDGSSKNRLSIVKRFNEDEKIPVFLVSLKAGGSGLNLTGADTVIHYDIWWNPAVEDQATGRVHRLGQRKDVSDYKLVTLGTIEEKILELQNRKKGLVKKVISSDEEAISKLTWEEVLELLKT